MSRTLVLVRHGKAHASQEGQPDAARTLTTAGKRSLKATLPDSLIPIVKELSKGADIVIWASPAVRACQTAEIVCDILGIKEFEKHDVIAGSDPEAMFAEAQSCTHDIVIIVGHTPSVDKISQIASGCRVPFKPGGVCCLTIDGERGMPENLRWFAQGPLVTRWERIGEVEYAISTTNSAVGRCYRAFIDKPSDPESLHDLRVSIRTLRSLLIFVSPFLKSKPTRKVEECLRDLVTFTSRLREFDVLAHEIAELEPTAEDLAQACATARTVEAERTLDAFAARKSQRALAWVNSTVKHLPWKDSVISCGLGPTDLNERYDNMCESFDKKFTSLDLTDVDATHDARKDAKLLRYVSRTLRTLLGNESSEIEGRMRLIQDELGDLCDARVNLDICDHFPREGLSATAVWDLSRLRAQEEARAWKLLRHITVGK